MVDAIISVVLDRLAPMIEQRVRNEVGMWVNPADEANNLASKLKSIKELLDDAEQRGFIEPKVKRWLDKLQDISYEMDDVLDWEDTRHQMVELGLDHPASDPPTKVSSFLKSICLCSHRVVERRTINSSIKKLNKELDVIREQNEKDFKFAPNVRPGYSHDSKLVRESTSLVEVSKVHGRDDDKENLVSKLLSEGSSQMESGLPVISIVGVGGLGKTTLAQLVFNDEKVQNHFQVKVWVCVSDPFDQIKIAKAMLEELKKETPNLSSLQTLVGAIAEAISGKIFLLVLDDVWTEDETMWDPIKNSLKNGTPSSRILVTTRNEKAAKVVGSNEMQIHRLRELPDSECWKVFKQLAFFGRDEDKNLEEIGWKIVEKCKGLPLAAKAMGGLLRFKNSLEEWRKVLESPVWELKTAREKIFPFLVLSYNELNPVARRCFSYCAIFPKDTYIFVDVLIRIWCAQGFFSSDDMELEGRETFDDLAMRSFFQDFEREEDIGVQIVGCKMHDIVHDFAQFLTENECVIAKSIDSGEKSRHFNLVVETNKNPFPLPNGKWHGYEKCRSFFTRKCAIPLDFLKHLKRVRVLVMNDCKLEVIGREIGSSIHLRYLDLTNNPIKELLETICDLYNLQTLILDRCENLSRLPEGIHKLRNLRHFLNSETDMEFPQGLGELTNLQTLREIDIAPGRNWKNLGWLRNLNHLHGSLSIYIEGSDDPDELVQAIERANLKTKNLIQHLTLWFSENVPIEVIEGLQPHLDLKSLYLSCPFLPKWFTSLTQLKCLRMIGGIYSLPALGKQMPFLERLFLEYLDGMEILRHELLGISGEPTNAFPRLKTLHFHYCRKWKEWEDISEEEESNNNISVFPSLQTLEIYHCPKLEALPNRLLRKATSLKNLKVHGCDKLKASYKDWESLTKIPGLIFETDME